MSSALVVLAFLIPGAILGLIVWGIVGITRGRAEGFTLATAAALYARTVTIVGTLMALFGAGILVKWLLSRANIAWSYCCNNYYPTPVGASGVPKLQVNDYLQQQQAQDLLLGLTLLALGILFALLHAWLASSLSRLPGGSPSWLQRGSLLALTVTTALGAIPAAAIGIYSLLSYFIITGPNVSPQPFGDSLGPALAFTPAWLFFTSRLLANLHRKPVVPSAPASSALPTS